MAGLFAFHHPDLSQNPIPVASPPCSIADSYAMTPKEKERL
ncbi:hypothetical protein ETAE_1413 [Edwardsiella piscicida]|uniref:Uncharacterized protein n=1 Tax=Edwardsiella piscicida TaxID=1263550 RepID=A0AAU8PQ61_EDWPI|nr:hypothetical protein ETAE_1413 [Edwardsiella tarda EIB202]